MAEWTDVRIEDELRAVLRREVTGLPVAVTPLDVLARRRTRRRIRRPRLALLAAALLVVPLSQAAGIAVLAPADGSPYLAVLARGLSTTDFGTPNEHVPDLELVLAGPDAHETPVLTIPATRFDGWKTTREYALSPDGRWLAMALQDASSDDPRPEAPPLAVIDLHDAHVRLVTGGRLEPLWTADGTLWWSVAGHLQRVDLLTGDLRDGEYPLSATATRPAALPSLLDQIDESGEWDIVSVRRAGDGGAWILVRRDPYTSDISRLVYRDRVGIDRWGPEFPGNTEMAIMPNALDVAPDGSLAAIRGHDYKRVSTGEIAPGRTIVVDVGTGQAFEHTGWLVGFVRADAAADWASTAGGSR